MWEYIKTCDLHLLWQTLNSGIVTTIFGIFIGSWVTLKIVEETKRKAKKELLLSILYKELTYYAEPCNTTITKSFQFSQRDKLIWNILTSDILEPQKDKEIINSMYELIGFIENFNLINHFANEALINNNEDMLLFYSKGRDELYNKSYIERGKLLKLLETKYKIKL